MLFCLFYDELNGKGSFILTFTSNKQREVH